VRFRKKKKKNQNLLFLFVSFVYFLFVFLFFFTVGNQGGMAGYGGFGGGQGFLGQATSPNENNAPQQVCFKSSQHVVATRALRNAKAREKKKKKI
jgi:hypothetical protein